MNWSLLRLPAFRAVWLGRLLSWVASGIGPIALVFAALDLGATATELGLVVAARAVPNLVLILFGGVVADRRPKRMIAQLASVLSALSLAVGALLLATGVATLPLLAMVGALNGAGAAFFAPATSAVVRDIVGEALIRDATVLNRVSMNLGLVVGSAVGGGLVGTFSPEIALAVGSLLFTGAVAAFAGLPRTLVGAVRGRAFVHDLVEGLGFVLRTHWLLATLLLTLVAQLVFAAGVQVLGPIAADESFGRTLWGFAGAFQTLGLVVGAAFAGSLRGRLRLSTASLAAAATALPLVVLALMLALDPRLVDPLHWFFWLSFGLFLASVGIELFAIPLDVAVQLQVPRPYLARVYACLTLASLAGMPLGETVAGPLARAFGAPTTLIGLAVFVALVAGAVAALPRVRRVDAELR